MPRSGSTGYFTVSLPCNDLIEVNGGLDGNEGNVTLEDDLDGGPAEETVRFGFGDIEYEIDLTNKNALAFRELLAPFIEHARTAGRAARRSVSRGIQVA